MWGGGGGRKCDICTFIGIDWTFDGFVERKKERQSALFPHYHVAERSGGRKGRLRYCRSKPPRRTSTITHLLFLEPAHTSNALKKLTLPASILKILSSIKNPLSKTLYDRISRAPAPSDQQDRFRASRCPFHDGFGLNPFVPAGAFFLGGGGGYLCLHHRKSPKVCCTSTPVTAFTPTRTGSISRR